MKNLGNHSVPRLSLLAALLIGGLPVIALAQGAPVPNAGSILQQSQPGAPPAPSPRGPGLQIQQPDGGTAPASTPFTVTRIEITGNTVFDGATLSALVQDAQGQSMTLAQLQAVAARITEYYRGKGYPLARAILPAQTITGGVVTIQVIEARYGNIRLGNTSRVRDSLLQSTLGLQPGAVINGSALDRGLLLLSDIPGVSVAGSLKPGAAVGTSDLEVATTPTPMLYGDAAVDDYGNKFTGRARLRGSLNIADPLRHGDLLSFSAFTSGSGLSYGRAAYDILLNGWGTHLGGSYVDLKYQLGGSLAPLQANGTAKVGSLWAKQVFVRGRDFNLYGQLQVDQKKLKDHIDSTLIRNDRHLDNWSASLAGDTRDRLLAGGINTFNLIYTAGRVGFDDPAAQISDAATARTQGNFSKWNLYLARLQALTPRNTLYLSLSSQWANNNLDSSEKISVGGNYSVRGYDTGAISGDNGTVGTVELRHDFAALGSQWQAVLFADSAHVKVNRNPWAAGTNSANLNGAGAGLNWQGFERFNAKVYVAQPIGSTPALVGTRSSTRVWAEVGIRF